MVVRGRAITCPEGNISAVMTSGGADRRTTPTRESRPVPRPRAYACTTSLSSRMLPSLSSNHAALYGPIASKPFSVQPISPKS